MKQLPTLEQIKQIENPMKVKNENKFITDHQNVVKELEPLIKFIDFRRIEGQILTDVIEPLEIISEKIILDVYRQKAKLNESDLNNIRGIPIPVCVWDDTACGSKLIFENNGKIVRLQSQTKSSRNVKAKMILEDKGKQPVGWVLGTRGRCYNSGNYINNYCPSFGDGARITVHLDMNKRTCSFTVNGTKYKEVTEWNNLPSKLYPVASLCYPGRFRIEPHQKYI
ncbi:hypothetical protein C1646_815825 [Rhizophagus diaphanus]|nr:hypothetical protein C1646_815825 [Rhizophagus diaphanus] [Rhizophagus sp. MUCL 43196]